MKLNNKIEKSGKCFVCGKDTRLTVHKECGEKMDAINKKKPKVKKYNSYYLKKLSVLNN